MPNSSVEFSQDKSTTKKSNNGSNPMLDSTRSELQCNLYGLVPEAGRCVVLYRTHSADLLHLLASRLLHLYSRQTQLGYAMHLLGPQTNFCDGVDGRNEARDSLSSICCASQPRSVHLRLRSRSASPALHQKVYLAANS